MFLYFCKNTNERNVDCLNRYLSIISFFERRDGHPASFLFASSLYMVVFFACRWKGAKRVSHYACDAQEGINHWLLQCNCSACFLSAVINTIARTTLRRTRKAEAFQTMGIIQMNRYGWLSDSFVSRLRMLCDYVPSSLVCIASISSFSFMIYSSF